MKLNIDDKIIRSVVAVAALVFTPIILTALVFILSFGIIIIPLYVSFFTMYSTVCWVWVIYMTYLWGYVGTLEDDKQDTLSVHNRAQEGDE